ncbi:hypothetical protein D1AOALGA4SA_12708 [Olavius algarvensis Delta 1 endosymbiont]|nr:hypothetical protein D1AOALGA4SA_12708 [Olavius algarvensis Delta 1 endosymbiont]
MLGPLARRRRPLASSLIGKETALGDKFTQFPTNSLAVSSSSSSSCSSSKL